MKGICFVEPLFNRVVDGSKTQTRRICGFRGEDLSEIEKAKLLATCRYRLNEEVYLKEPYIDDLSMDDVFYKYGEEDPMLDYSYAWKNKLFMPESAARYFIKITGVKIERLQDISDEDCLKEGIYEEEWGGYFHPGNDMIWTSPKGAYEHLINSIDGLETWGQNPYVYVYDFELIEL